MSLQRLAILSVHTSPLAPMGGKKTGGMNVYILELARELGRRGVAVDIFTRRSDPTEPNVDARIGDNVRVIYLTAGGVRPLAPDDVFPFLPEFTARLIAFATTEGRRYDLVYSHYWLSGWVAQKLKEAWGTRFVQMFHTLGEMKQRITGAERHFLPDQRIQTEQDIAQWADALIAATPAENAQLMWLYRAKRRKIHVVPPGVDVERFVPLPKSFARSALGYSERHLLLFVGRIEPLKALDTVLEALANLKMRNPSLLAQTRLLVVGGNLQGDDPELMHLQSMVRTLGLADSVSFVGAKSQQDLPCYYAAASAVLMPSDYESFGMVALEAMASGTPVIASAVGGLAFLVEDGETGFHVPVREPQVLSERIETLLEDDTLRDHMGRKAAHVARDYAWGKIAERLLTIFNDICSSSVKTSV